MRNSLAKNWGLLVIRGLAAVAFGLLTFFWPAITVAVLVILFGVYALIDGVASIGAAVRNMERGQSWGWLVLEGIVGILVAIVTVFWPAITALALVILVAFRAIFGGMLEIATAVRLRKIISGEWMMILIGVLSIAFGIFIAAVPLVGILAIAIWVGAYAVVVGVLQIALGIRLRSELSGHGQISPMDMPFRPVPR